MKFSCRVAVLIALLAACLPIYALCIQAQESSPYTDTTADFQRFLQDILDATKKGDQPRVESLLKSTEIPDCDAWLHRMYKSDSADSWMGLCDAKKLSSQEKSMEGVFAGFAKEGGEFSTRKVNDNPEGGEGGLESGMVGSGTEPLEVYFASWSLQTNRTRPRANRLAISIFSTEDFAGTAASRFQKLQSAMQNSFPQNSSRKWNPFSLPMPLPDTFPGPCACTT